MASPMIFTRFCSSARMRCDCRVAGVGFHAPGREPFVVVGGRRGGSSARVAAPYDTSPDDPTAPYTSPPPVQRLRKDPEPSTWRKREPSTWRK